MEAKTTPQRIIREFTPAERERWLQARAQAKSELPSMIAKGELLTEAAAGQTFSGALRRTVNRSPLSLATLACNVGIELIELDEFLSGKRVLGSDVLDRLIQAVEFVYPPQSPSIIVPQPTATAVPTIPARP